MLCSVHCRGTVLVDRNEVLLERNILSASRFENSKCCRCSWRRVTSSAESASLGGVADSGTVCTIFCCGGLWSPRGDTSG